MARGDNPNSRANLVKNSDLTPKERQEKASVMGRASGEARQKRKSLKEELLALLETGDYQHRMSLSLLMSAIDGNTKAFEVIRDTIGEKPVEKIEQTNVEVLVEFEDDEEDDVDG